MSSPSETAATLANRNQVFGTLVESPKSKSAILDVVDCSRSTLDRAIREFRDLGLVQYTDGSWRLTTAGSCIGSMTERYYEMLTDVDESLHLINTLPPSSPIGTEMLNGVTGLSAESSTPDLILPTLSDKLSGNERLRIVLPRLMLGLAKCIVGCIETEATVDIELVVPSEAFERVDAVFPGLGTAFVDTPQRKLSFASSELPFGFWIADEPNVGVVVFDGSGVGGLLINDTAAAYEWCNGLYDDVREKMVSARLSDR